MFGGGWHTLEGDAIVTGALPCSGRECSPNTTVAIGPSQGPTKTVQRPGVLGCAAAPPFLVAISGDNVTVTLPNSPDGWAHPLQLQCEVCDQVCAVDVMLVVDRSGSIGLVNWQVPPPMPLSHEGPYHATHYPYHARHYPCHARHYPYHARHNPYHARHYP